MATEIVVGYVKPLQTSTQVVVSTGLNLVTNLTQLQDVDNYAEQFNKYARVETDGTGIEWVDIENQVFGRNVIQFANGATYNTYVDNGKTKYPFLRINGKNYLPTLRDGVAFTITSETIADNGDGTIIVTTSGGNKSFSSFDAEAVRNIDYAQRDAKSLGYNFMSVRVDNVVGFVPSHSKSNRLCWWESKIGALITPIDDQPHDTTEYDNEDFWRTLSVQSVLEDVGITPNVGNWSDVVGMQLNENDRNKSWSYPDDSNVIYSVRENVSLPITFPATPIYDDRFYNSNIVNVDSLKTSTVITTDTVSTMIDIDLPVGAMVQTKGYYNINDDGAAIYIITNDAYDGFVDIQLNNGNVASLAITPATTIDQCGVKANDKSAATRTLNDDAFEAILNNQKIKSVVGLNKSYYKHTGIIMDTAARLTNLDSDGICLFYLDGITDDIELTSCRKSLLPATLPNLLPLQEPSATNCMLSVGTKSAQIGRFRAGNWRFTNETLWAGSNFPLYDKTTRRGLGIFIHSGAMELGNLITDYTTVGSIIVSWVNQVKQLQHYDTNIGMCCAGGTSMSGISCVVDAKNAIPHTGNYQVNYTPDEEDRFFGTGYIFSSLQYSNFNSLACDNTQTPYAIIGANGSPRSQYVLDGAGTEYAITPWYINDPTAIVDIRGGFHWGKVSRIERVYKLKIGSNWFPYTKSNFVSAGQIEFDNNNQWLSPQNPADYSNEHAQASPEGYHGLSWDIVDYDESNYRTWRIKGIVKMNDFEMRLSFLNNMACFGTIKFYPTDVGAYTSEKNSRGEVFVSAMRKRGQYIHNVDIASTLTDVSSNYNVDVADNLVIKKTALSENGKITAHVDLTLETLYSSNFADPTQKPNQLIFKNIDY